MVESARKQASEAAGGCDSGSGGGSAKAGWQTAAAVIGLVAIGLAVGLPTLDGDFLAGDDVMLLRDHALINHPSPANAWELLTIVHRDLYQPLPMLSFQLDHIWFGRSLAAGQAWGIHLTNVAYHVLNGLLVWLLIGRLSGKRSVAFLAGAAFLAHPLAIESVAWLSGRMMLMSAFFLLITLIFFDKWQMEGHGKWLAFSALACLACVLSKVRVELPFLLIFLRYYRGLGWRSGPWWSGFALVSIISTGFSLYAVETTEQAGVWEQAAEKFEGPSLARVVRTLGWYFSHYFWPANLSGWYYPPVEITWTQPAVIGSMLLIAACLLWTAWWWSRGQRCSVGMLFFLAGIGPMLQYFPSRFTLACDRYMYIPMIGLHWMFGSAIVALVTWWRVRSSSNRPVIAAGLVGAIVLGLWIRGSIVHGADYADDVALRKRDTELYGHLPGSWARLGWAYIRQEHYRKGLEAAMVGLDLPNQKDALAAQAVGFAYYKLGDYEKAAEYLERAYRQEPDSPKPAFRLGRVYEALGRYEEAVALYRESIAKLHFYEPALMALADLQRRLGRADEAVALYETVLRNNRHQYQAAYNLGTLELELGRIGSAMERFVKLIEWMPEHVDARTQLGVCLARMGKNEQAGQLYDGVLLDAPNHTLARINRAELRRRTGDLVGAQRDYEYLLRGGGYPLAAVSGLSMVYAERGSFDRAAALWRKALAASGTDDGQDAGDETIRENVLWYSTLAGMSPAHEVGAQAETLHEKNPEHPVPMLTLGWLAFEENRREEAERWFALAGGCETADAPDAISSAMFALEHRSRAQPDDPWPYYMGGVLMQAAGNRPAARAGFKAFLSICQEEVWRAKAAAHLAELAKAAESSGADANSQPTTKPTVGGARQPTSEPGASTPANP